MHSIPRLKVLSAIAICTAVQAQVGWQTSRKGVVSFPGDATRVVHVGDIDNDSKPDFLYLRPTRPNQVAMTFGRGSYDAGSRVRDFAWQDWNGDRVEDLLLGLPEHAQQGRKLGSFRVIDGQDLRKGVATPRILQQLIGTVVDDGFGTSFLALEANRDQRLDVLVVSKSTTSMFDRASLQSIWRIGQSSAWTNVGDFDRDGVDDIFGAPHLRSGRTGKILRSIGRSIGIQASPVGDLTGDGVSEFVDYGRQDDKAVVMYLWSGRGYAKLGEWSYLGFVGAPRFRAHSPRHFSIVFDRDGVILADLKFRARRLASAIGQRVDGAIPWRDLDEDGLDEHLVLAVDRTSGRLVGDVHPEQPYSAYANTLEVQSTTGGRQDFTFLHPTSTRGKLCVVLGGVSGRFPSFRFGQRDIPLVFDAYTSLLLSAPNSFFSPSVFTLPTSSSAQATLAIPAMPSLKGTRLDHLYIVFDTTKPASLSFLSNLVPLWIR